jgi:hypothetical protein
MSHSALCRDSAVRVVAPSDVPLQGLVVDASGMGAPTAGMEKLDSFEDQVWKNRYTVDGQANGWADRQKPGHPDQRWNSSQRRSRTRMPSGREK